MRADVAANASAPAEVLRALAADADAEVRVGAASNPSTPDESLKALATDGDYRVRADAVENLKRRVKARRNAVSQKEKGSRES